MNETNTETWKIGDKSRGTRVKYNDLRNNAVPMKEKRRLREVRQSEGYNPSFWTHKHYSCVLPYWNKGEQVISIFKLWGKTLIAIRAKFGSSISSYFLFLRFLMLLNLASLILTTGFIIVPTILLSKTEHNHSYLAPCGNSSAFPNRTLPGHLLDLFTGEGFMQDTFLFYGHYGGVVEFDDAFSVRLSYLLTPFVFLLICSLLLLQRTVKGITQRRVRSRQYRTSISSKVFSGWDFCVRETGTSVLKQKRFSNDIKSDLAEEHWYMLTTQQSLGVKVRIVALRVFLNCIILALMAGGFYFIYLATGVSQGYQERSDDPILNLMTQYLVPVVISLVLLILPYSFMLLVKFEGLSPSAEITLTLVRCVFLRLGTLGIFLFSLGQTILCVGGTKAPCEICGYNMQFQCWETSVGQEFYKLSMFHFLELLAEFLFLKLPRSLLFSRYQCRLIRWFGKEKFILSQNVLDMVYGQTLVWGGMFYTPLLPLLNLIFIFITFYIKKFSMFHLYDVSERLFQESTLRIMFNFVLFLGLMTVFLPLTYLLTSARPSRSCGLFTDYNTPWEAVKNRTHSALPPTALTYLTSDIGAYILLLILSLVLTCYVSRVRQNELDVELLKEHLSNQIEDKEFLVRRLRKEEDIQSHTVDP
ncbi:transmembrane channel-like protein 8 isoform X1 [Bufo gargarizans]|uniref:transmembrane channel-like protein 8 isoform X1 n=2 Tax=Bufo gargarizans TaxID=30331 RepID=UPI001CF126DD|nr:transmembrane channel-like protein 8 isoform X1 [Bufo gargarizans]XP_044156139.1 transmembrane channel-like protein 8 isoform X1 [Bufo gargarizans]XP_044156140.1 transmembrane channel-like protein 8 isoform X1 [Bufo gargarizans]